MNSYILQDEVASKEAIKRLKKHLKDERILEIGINDKEEPFVRTDWHIYIAKLKGNTVKIPVIWSQSKKPYLIGGIGLVLFFMFFIGGILTDFAVVAILFALGLVNVFKRNEITTIKNAMCEALNH